MTHPPHFNRLSDVVATVFDASDLTAGAFQTAPIVLAPTFLRQMAFSLSPKPGLALEFGVFKGSSIRRLALDNPEHRFYGFDSFNAPPGPRRPSPDNAGAAGQFAAPQLPLVPENVRLVRGFFDQTLHPWLEKNPGSVGFVHIDCGLYGGTKTVLAALTGRLLPGAVIVFGELGEWEDEGVRPNQTEGEWRALREWLAETGMRLRILGRGVKNQAAIQVWSEPSPHGRPKTLSLIKAVRDCGATNTATMLIDTVWADPAPWLSAAHLSLTWDDTAHPARTLERIRRITTQVPPGSALAGDMLFVQARAFFALNRVEEAYAAIRRYLKKNPRDVPAIRFAIKVAKASNNFEHAKNLAKNWTLLTGQPEAAAQAADCARLAQIRPEFRFLQFSGLLVQHLLDTRNFQTVLDVGSGSGEHAQLFRAAGKQVTEIDYGRSIHAAKHPDALSQGHIIGDFMEIDIDRQFDCVFASHILEHQKNAHAFLAKLHALLQEGGILGLSVPPMKPEIVGGHVSIWNAGLLLYNLVLAGFDCRRAWVRTYGYNISVALEKTTVDPQNLVYGGGDIQRIAAFLPEGLTEGFNGDIHTLG